MAKMVIPNEGKQKFADGGVHPDGVTAEDYVVDLYSNSYTPTDSSTASSFTPCSFTGYAQVSVPRSSFAPSVIVANIAVATSSVSPTYSCSAGAGQTAYGWYMRGVSSNKVYAAAVFDNPRSMAAGATETISPFQIQFDKIT